jgi:hypothetical protein
MRRRAALTAAVSRVDLMSLVRQIGQVMFCMESNHSAVNQRILMYTRILMRTLSRIQAKRLLSNAVVISDHGN